MATELGCVMFAFCPFVDDKTLWEAESPNCLAGKRVWGYERVKSMEMTVGKPCQVPPNKKGEKGGEMSRPVRTGFSICTVAGFIKCC